MDVFTTLLKVLHLVLCVLVIGGVLLMNQKSEGLSGIMGGSSFSTRGGKGMDHGMRRLISWLGGLLISSAILLGILGV